MLPCSSPRFVIARVTSRSILALAYLDKIAPPSNPRFSFSFLIFPTFVCQRVPTVQLFFTKSAENNQQWQSGQKSVNITCFLVFSFSPHYSSLNFRYVCKSSFYPSHSSHSSQTHSLPSPLLSQLHIWRRHFTDLLLCAVSYSPEWLASGSPSPPSPPSPKS